MKYELDVQELAREIKYKRCILLNVSMKTVSKAIGISPATISRIENGGMPDVNTLLNITDWLGKSTDGFAKKVKGKRPLRGKQDIQYTKSKS